MKFKYCFLLLSVIALVNFSCSKGPKGDMGPAGSTGATGATGSTGATGATGTANVVYSKWMVVDSSKWTYNQGDSVVIPDLCYGITYQDTIINYHYNIPMANITQGILDSGLVYFYIKDSAIVGPNSGAVLSWTDFLWYNGNVYLTNRPYHNIGPDWDSSFSIRNEPKLTAGQYTVQLNWVGMGGCNYNPNAITHKEMAPKTKFYVRSVAIPGGKLAGGRISTAVNFKDYASVKKYFNIPD